MEILNVSTRSNFPILSGVPTFHHIKTLNQKFPSKHKKPSSRFHRNTFPLYVTIFNTRSFRTWAHFGRPTSRRNSLRKKLLDDRQVRLNQNLIDRTSEIQNPSSRFSDIGGLEERSNNNALEDNEAAKGMPDHNEVEKAKIEKAKSKPLGESVLMNKLENWVDQYKKDVEYWGIGSGPIFTVYQDSSGNVKEVSIDEVEILRRSRVQKEEIEDFPEVNYKILSAKSLAREMENGNNVIPKNSSVAKFIVQGNETRFVKAIRGFTIQPELLPKLSGVGSRILCVFVFLWAVKKLFSFGEKETQHTEREKEMMRRKIKSRKDKEMLKGTVDVIPQPPEPPTIYMEKPKLDKEQLKNNIMKVKASAEKLIAQNSSTKATARSMDKTSKVQEIRDMARKAQEIEGKNHSLGNRDRELDDFVIEELSNKVEVVNTNIKEDTASLSKHQNDVVRTARESNGTLQTSSLDVAENIDNPFLHDLVPSDRCNLHASNTTGSDDKKINKQEIEITESTENLKDKEVSQLPDTPIDDSSMTKESFTNKKPRVIRSVKEAKDYLLKKNEKQEAGTEPRIQPIKDNSTDLRFPTDIDAGSQKSRLLEMSTTMPTNNALIGMSDSKLSLNVGEDSNQKDTEFGLTKNNCIKGSGVEHEAEDPENSETSLNDEVNSVSIEHEAGDSQNSETSLNHEVNGLSVEHEVGDPQYCEISLNHEVNDVSIEHEVKDPQNSETSLNNEVNGVSIEHEGGDPQNSETSLNQEVNGVSTSTNQSVKTESWLEKNLNEVEPIIKKIRAGFRDNYMAAKEGVDQTTDITTEIEPLEDGGELDWIQNEHLRDVVFKVRDNELAGRDPFYLMDEEDKEAFFRGLEKKVEKENKKLSYLHEWLHSNIENLDYGSDGISMYDPPEKIIPRWKGPSVEKIPDFLNDFLEQRKTTSMRKMEPVKNDENGFAEKSAALSSHENVKNNVATSDSMKIDNKNQKSPKTIVEGSDGSIKSGKKSGKEYWQHTKKWSRGFLESYNAETDPEVKSTMKGIGKDLDRWITEKEIQEAADLMNRIPERNRSILETKLSKVKREMELFGPQAVVSKYREYADEKEEDYLWWLDLSYILCIELYTIEDGEQRVGFYSLEMAKDLEVEPKPCHVIAFQDAGDCKSLCYIIQTHLEMLGNGQAFVVARPPKDAFREAKANGFGVTVIKKGELQLNIDQPLEEVEEQITEIGSKMYHDMIMKEQSVDINALMKGVFGFSDRSIKRFKRRMKKPGKR